MTKLHSEIQLNNHDILKEEVNMKTTSRNFLSFNEQLHVKKKKN